MIDSCFDLDLLDYRNLVEIETSPLTKLVCRYRDFETVLRYAGSMRYDIDLLAGVCGTDADEIRRELLEKELLSVLQYFDYWQPEEVKAQYTELIGAYENCLMSE